ncbi:hypothetical protein DZB72_21190 [Bacillus sp. MT]|uniref:hypothetical protein n=1 Tax=Bacillus sp. MT TaxID=2293323 RepID=UPI000E2F3BF8|nr:hypothetical protein [Bacillus sp. MT]RFB01839.1 hypothetical protein DZB72_21190 [Bacillus sp. MT]
MKKWVAKDGAYTYTITENSDGTFGLNINHPVRSDSSLWFHSYKSARDYLRREEYFMGRMKQVKEGAE